MATVDELAMEIRTESNQKTLNAEYDNSVNHAVWAQIPTAVIVVEGPDRTKWLHKIITADVENVATGQGVRSALLDAKGHFAADFVMLVEQDSILLLTTPESNLPLLAGLRRYVIRERVQLGDRTQDWKLFSVIGPESDSVIEKAFGSVAPASAYSFARTAATSGASSLVRGSRARVPATEVLSPAAGADKVKAALDSIPEVDARVLEILRIEAGLPEWGADFDSSTLVMEIPGVHQVRVDQGCYVGQEVVARLVHRGHVNRSLVGLKFEGERSIAKGTPLMENDKQVGLVTSSCLSPSLGMIGLGYVRREASEDGSLLRAGDRAYARIARLPFED